MEPLLTNFKVPSIFVGLFLRKLDEQDYKKMAEMMPWRLPELDGQPRLANNVPANAPAHAARAAFSSKDGRKVLEVAPGKIQLRVIPGEVVETGTQQKQLKPYGIKEAFEDFKPFSVKVYNVFAEHFGATANRVGIMTEMFVHLGSSANQRVQSTVLTDPNMFGDRLHEIRIEALSKTTVGGDRAVNRWVRLKPIRANDENKQDLALGVSVDINTLPEDSYDLTAADVENFINNVHTHIEEKIPLFHDAKLLAQG